MEFIKTKQRSFKKVNTPEGLEHVLKKYVDINNLFIRKNGESSPLKIITMNDDLTLLVQYNNVIQSDQVNLFTILSRYLEFDAEVLERHENNGEGMQYLLKLNTCHIAQEVRESQRFDSTTWDLYAGHITTLKIIENPVSIMRSVSSQLFFKECEKTLEDYEFRKSYFCNEKDLPGEIRYAVAAEKPLLIENLKDAESIFSQDPDFFSKRLDIKEEIAKRFALLSEQYHSMVIRPISYMAIDGRKFTIGYIATATPDRVMGQEDIERIDSAAVTTYKKIRDANLVVTEERIKVVDISQGGLKLLTGNTQMVKTLSTQDFVLFSLIFKLQQPIRLSGGIAYIRKVADRSFHVGISFKGSDFGQKAKILIQQHIEKCINENSIH